MKKFRFFNYFSAEIKKNIAKLIIRKTKLKILYYLKKRMRRAKTTLIYIIKQNKLKSIPNNNIN